MCSAFQASSSRLASLCARGLFWEVVRYSRKTANEVRGVEKRFACALCASTIDLRVWFDCTALAKSFLSASSDLCQKCYYIVTCIKNDIFTYKPFQ
jgi:hypothetical protein